MLLAMWPCATFAQEFVNLTPRPKTMTVGTGTLTLPSSFVVSYTGLDEAQVAEVENFVTAFNAATGYAATAQADATSALFNVSMLPSSSTVGTNGYTLNVTADGVAIQAKDVLGLFYAFQSVKKILPANVMAGVADASVTAYTLPIVSITDEPRFAYRGFMLDVARHFFTVEEVKRMIDVMSYYKMNAFHWHLSDDQGWRVEIKKYPKLTSVGSIAPNSRFTDMDECTQYWINKPYGPYFYTQEEIKDVVAYAQARHIDVIPEIDMPGHFCAALAAYPEFSCTPTGSHTVQTDGGIYSDVMNVANPDAVQFTKDVLDELMELFPYDYLHIGGDECPTTAWESNAECQAAYKAQGLTSYRQLQSLFIKELADHVKAKGRKLAVWNEAITASGADTDLMQETGATVYCWTSPEAAVTKANGLGLPSIYTPWGPYYINRKQGSSSTDPPGAGDGTDHVQKTYNTTPPTATSLGVQGTFWTEHVSDREYMEWLALPRLLAVAEAGWTPQANKDFADFQERMTADTTLLNYGGYRYCKYYMLGEDSEDDGKVMPLSNTDEKKYYYRLISGGTDATRLDRCIELLSSTSSLLTTYSSYGAQAGRLWTNTQAAEGDENYDYQWWSVEEDPDNPGKYALVCKAIPEGSVNPNPTANSTSGRWTYDNTTKNYNFELGTGAYGTKNNNYYYSIASDQVSGKYFNSSMSGQGLAVNVYSAPTDGAGGQWEFSPLEDYGQGSGETPVTFTYLEEGKTYSFTNAVDGFDATAICDDGESTRLSHSTDPFAQIAWQVSEAEVNDDGSQTFKLSNAATGRYVDAVGTYETRLGRPVTMESGSTTLTVTLTYIPEYDDFRLAASGYSFFPLPTGLVNAGTTISGATYDASRNQGAEWNVQEVRGITFNCVDDSGNALGTYVRYIPVSVTEITSDYAPAFTNHSLESMTAAEDNAYTVVYKRNAYAVTYNCVDTKGAIVARDTVNVSVGQATYTVALPTPDYYTLVSSEEADGTSLTLTADRTINVTYSTDAYTGSKGEADVVTTLEGGKSYLFYDASSDDARVGYRMIRESDMAINRSTTAEGLLPSGVWTLEGQDNSFRVKNEYYNLYVPALVRSTATTASTSGVFFTFNLNSDGETWNIKGSNGQYWDGVATGDLVGWDGGTGHPIRISTYFAQPYYELTVLCQDSEGTTLSETSTLFVAGTAHTLTLPTFDGYELVSTTGTTDYSGVMDKHVNVVATYRSLTEGINGVTIDSDKAARSGIYDLQGRRLQSVKQRGVYIVDGKKIVVK